MIKHNNIIELLKGIEGEWRTLGEVAEIANNTRKPVKTSLRIRGVLPYYGANNIQDYVEGYTHNGEYVLIAEDGSANLKNYSIQWATGKFWANNHVHIVQGKPELNNRFLYHYLRNMNFIPYLTGGDRAKLTKSNLIEITIPIPPLHIQTEIVRILDTFTELSAELTAELTARKKQYNYYRDKLLTFKEDEVEWKALGDISEKIYSGGTPKTDIAKYWENGTIPWMSSGEVNLTTVYKTEKFISETGLRNSSAKFVPKNSVVIALAGQGKTRGKVARTRIDLTTNQSLASLTFDENKVNSDYIFHFLNTQYENLRQISSGNGARGGLNLQMISSYKVPIPSLKEQDRIVKILDKFEALTNSLTEGLPREIELRQKQYEYYRNLLLNFPKVEDK
ncbi:restriction endonuclease subunit S [Snodgrassella alvi]|uniref:Restriction endonuclease subunit S n=1 Tax=Snodgrassella alvi TaxID=1196083 RepID=A0A2N9X7V2_9NEIS|nr:restriction endonuclease subunit S [Snodgrassella alvi]PIT39961.1 restriction endonuclease subunit S [Snodgrassella alvi]